MSLIESIVHIQEREFKEKWVDGHNIVNFELALQIAKFIRVGDETRTPKSEERIIKKHITDLAAAYGLRVIQKRESDETWEG